MPRFLSPTIEFVIAGTPLISGNRSKSLGCSGYAAEHYNLVRLTLKSIMAEQGWKITDKPIFLAITIYISVHDNNVPRETVKEMYKGKHLVVHRPGVGSVIKGYIKCLKGILIKNEIQVVSAFVLKEYSRNERIEVLIGIPQTVKELKRDIRNC